MPASCRASIDAGLIGAERAAALQHERDLEGRALVAACGARACGPTWHVSELSSIVSSTGAPPPPSRRSYDPLRPVREANCRAAKSRSRTLKHQFVSIPIVIVLIGAASETPQFQYNHPSQKEAAMKPIAGALAAGMLFCCNPAVADEIDLSTWSCKKFMSASKEDVGVILAWLDGYYTDEDDPPTIDTGKLRDQCEEARRVLHRPPERSTDRRSRQAVQAGGVNATLVLERKL